MHDGTQRSDDTNANDERNDPNGYANADAAILQ